MIGWDDRRGRSERMREEGEMGEAERGHEARAIEPWACSTCNEGSEQRYCIKSPKQTNLSRLLFIHDIVQSSYHAC